VLLFRKSNQAICWFSNASFLLVVNVLCLLFVIFFVSCYFVFSKIKNKKLREYTGWVSQIQMPSWQKNGSGIILFNSYLKTKIHQKLRRYWWAQLNYLRHNENIAYFYMVWVPQTQPVWRSVKYELIILIWPKFKLQRSFGEYSYRIALVTEKFSIILLVTHSCLLLISLLPRSREFLQQDTLVITSIKLSGISQSLGLSYQEFCCLKFGCHVPTFHFNILKSWLVWGNNNKSSKIFHSFELQIIICLTIWQMCWPFGSS
jgi:hypothetical protein